MFSAKGIVIDHEQVKRLENMFDLEILAESALKPKTIDELTAAFVRDCHTANPKINNIRISFEYKKDDD